MTADLWSELSKVSSDGLNITRVMDTWTRQMGLPVLTVEQIKPTVYRVTQERYLLDPELAPQSESYKVVFLCYTLYYVKS